MIKATHFAVQISSDLWQVTFVSGIGITETRMLTAEEFAAVIIAERDLGLDADGRPH
jgi:hypothetical protein